MSIFNFFFKKDSEDQDPLPEEQSLNDLLFKMEREHNARVKTVFPRKIETAFDVIALINEFKHDHGSVYKDKKGFKYYKTKFGFKPVTVYNKELDNARLRAELDEKDKLISKLKAHEEQLTKQWQDEKAELRQNNLEKLEKLANRWQDEKAEIRQVLNNLINLEIYLKQKHKEHQAAMFKPGHKIDFTNPAEVRKRLVIAMDVHDALRIELGHISDQISSLEQQVSSLSKKIQ